MGKGALSIPRDRKIPAEHKDKPLPWKRAYAYAANYSVHNGVKACVVFAEARFQDEQFQDGEEPVEDAD